MKKITNKHLVAAVTLALCSSLYVGTVDVYAATSVAKTITITENVKGADGSSGSAGGQDANASGITDATAPGTEQIYVTTVTVTGTGGNAGAGLGGQDGIAGIAGQDGTAGSAGSPGAGAPGSPGGAGTPGITGGAGGAGGAGNNGGNAGHASASGIVTTASVSIDVTGAFTVTATGGNGGAGGAGGAGGDGGKGGAGGAGGTGGAGTPPGAGGNGGAGGDGGDGGDGVAGGNGGTAGTATALGIASSNATITLGDAFTVTATGGKGGDAGTGGDGGAGGALGAGGTFGAGTPVGAGGNGGTAGATGASGHAGTNEAGGAATANGIQLQNSTLNINAATQDFTVTATGGEGGSGALGGSGGTEGEGSKLTNMTWGDLGGNAVAGGLDLQQTQGNLAVQKILVTATGGAGGVGGGKAGNATATALQADGSTLQVTAKTVQAVANGSTSGTMEILGVKIPLFTGDITNTTDAQGVVLANSTMTLITDEVSATATGTDVAVGVRADSAKAQALVLDNASLQVSAFTEGGKIAIKAVAQDGVHGTVATKNATALDAKNNTSVVFNNAVDFTGEVKLDNSDVVLLGKGTTTVTDGNGAAANEAGSLSLANGSQLVSTDMLTITTGDLLVAGNSADPTQGSTVTLLNTGASTVGGDLTVKEQSTLQTSGDLTVTGDATLADSTLKLYNTNEVDGTLRSAEQYQAKADYNTLTVGGTLTTTGTNEVYLRTNANGVDIGYGRDQTTLASGVVAAGDKLATTGTTTADATNNLHIFDQGMRNGYQNQLDANGVAQFDPNNQVTLVTGNNLAAGTTTVAAVQYDNTIFNYTYTPELANDGTSVKVTGVKVDKTALSNTPKAAQQSRAAMVALLTAENETIWQRAEELRGKTEANGVWGKYVGGKQRAETGFGDADTTYNGVQIGYDRAVGKDWNVGVAFSYLNGSADVFGGDTDLKSKALTVYGLYTDDKGHFFDAALKYGKVDNDFTTYGGTVAQATKGEYSSNAYAASLAYGYRQELKNSKWYVEPRVSLTMGQLGSEDFTVQTQDGLLRVNADGVNTTALRFGSTFGTKVAKDTDFYIKAALGHEFSGGVDTYMNADGRRVLLSDDLGGTFFEYGIGLKGKMGKNSRYYLDLGGATGSPNHKVYGLSAGMLYSF